MSSTVMILASNAILVACADGNSGRLEVKEEILIPVDKLVADYGFDEDYILWRWDKQLAGGSMTGGNTWFLANDTTDRRGGIAFGFGSNAELFGRVCLGNLALEGQANLASDGLLLREGAVLLYPTKENPSPCSGSKAPENLDAFVEGK